MASDRSAVCAAPVRRRDARSRGALRCSLWLLGAAALMPTAVHAQPLPDTRQIIEALKRSPSPSQTQTQTRGLRNLVVREKSPNPVAAVTTVPPASIDLTIQFDFGSAATREESRPLLESLADALQSPELQGSRFLIEGHTDAVGSAAHNLKLSIDRADEVRRILVVSGVMPSRITTAGRGSEQPANAADPKAGENRRVRIVNLE
ncbi:MAG: OmpA family protein [Rhizobacter sp.]|nr:OmpA family protein [Rhizobacter sp.]